MGAAAHDIGCTHDHREPFVFGMLRGFDAGRKLRNLRTFRMSLIHMVMRGVVVARHGNALLPGVFSDPLAVRNNVALLQFLRQLHLALEFLQRPAFFAAVINPRVFDVFPLPLPGRVIHQ